MPYSVFSFLFCTVLLFACASAPYRTNLQLNPEVGKLSFSAQDLDHAYNTAVATGVDLGYRVVSHPRTKGWSPSTGFAVRPGVRNLEVSVQSNGPAADVGIVYQSPKPLWDATVKEFTDRFLAKLKAESSAPRRPAQASPVPRRRAPKRRANRGREAERDLPDSSQEQQYQEQPSTKSTDSNHAAERRKSRQGR